MLPSTQSFGTPPRSHIQADLRVQAHGGSQGWDAPCRGHTKHGNTHELQILIPSVSANSSWKPRSSWPEAFYLLTEDDRHIGRRLPAHRRSPGRLQRLAPPPCDRTRASRQFGSRSSDRESSVAVGHENREELR